jgi:hypothetical protein
MKKIAVIMLFVLFGLGLLGCSNATIKRQQQILHWQWASFIDADCKCPVCWEARK